MDYPLTDLDLSPYVISKKNGLNEDISLLYDLYAVSNHYGSLSFGHYTAYCKNPENGNWYDFNDSSVSQLHSENDVISNSAYVLYYIRKDFFPTKEYDFAAVRIGLLNDTNTIAHQKSQSPPAATPEAPMTSDQQNSNH